MCFLWAFFKVVMAFLVLMVVIVSFFCRSGHGNFCSQCILGVMVLLLVVAFLVVNKNFVIVFLVVKVFLVVVLYLVVMAF